MGMDENFNHIPALDGKTSSGIFQSPFDILTVDGEGHSQRNESESNVPWQARRTGSGHEHPNVFVRGIPLMWSEDEMITLFETCGALTSLRLVRHNVTKASLGYGFVRYGCLEDAQRAVDLLNGHVIGGQTLCVKFTDSDAGPPVTQMSSGLTPCDSCYVKHVPVSYGVEQVTSLFSMCGKVIDVKMFDCLDKFRGSSALVKMDSIDSASKAIQILNGMKPGNSLHALIVRFAESAKEKNERLARKHEGNNHSLLPLLNSGSIDASKAQQAISTLYSVPANSPALSARSLSGTLPMQTLPLQEYPRTIQIQNLPTNADRLWIYDNFARFGGITAVRHTALDNHACVTYTSQTAAYEALRQMNNFIVVDMHASLNRKLAVVLMEQSK